jgi:hypothetical protein
MVGARKEARRKTEKPRKRWADETKRIWRKLE